MIHECCNVKMQTAYSSFSSVCGSAASLELFVCCCCCLIRPQCVSLQTPSHVIPRRGHSSDAHETECRDCIVPRALATCELISVLRYRCTSLYAICPAIMCHRPTRQSRRWKWKSGSRRLLHFVSDTLCHGQLNRILKTILLR